MRPQKLCAVIGVATLLFGAVWAGFHCQPDPELIALRKQFVAMEKDFRTLESKTATHPDARLQHDVLIMQDSLGLEEKANDIRDRIWKQRTTRFVKHASPFLLAGVVFIIVGVSMRPKPDNPKEAE